MYHHSHTGRDSSVVVCGMILRWLTAPLSAIVFRDVKERKKDDVIDRI